MKLKGISWFEQHVEKIVLGVMVLILLGVISMQFLVEPNLIDVGGGQKIAPDKVFSRLEQDVNKLRAAVSEKTPQLPQVTTPDLVQAYRTAAGQGESLPSSLDIAFGPVPKIGGEEIVGPVADGPIWAMSVPEPAEPVAYAYWGTVDPYAVEDMPDLKRLLPAEQPYDVAGVSVESVVDGEKLQTLLREADGEHRPIPPTWWRPGVAVLEVVAERQQLGPEGQWLASETVERIPGAYDLVKESGLKDQPTPIQLREMVSLASKAALDIAQPEYIPQIAGPEWVPPTEAVERDNQYANMSDIDVLKAKRRSYLDRIARLQEELQNKPSTSGPKGPQFVPGGPGGGPGYSGQPKSGGGRDTQRDADRERQQEQRRIENLNNRIAEAQQQVKDVEKQLAEAGFPVTPEEDARSPRQMTSASQAESATLLGTADYHVWTHDLAVTPGATYRYRVRVKVNNPIYGKDRSLDASVGDDLDLAKQAYAWSDWSTWSEPVMVGRKTYVFLTSANEASRKAGGLQPQIGGGRASVSAEVYHMYYGHYRRGSILLEPGDTVSTEVRVPEELYLFDTEKVSKEQAHELLGITEQARRNRALPPSGPIGIVPGLQQPGLTPDDPNYYVPPERRPGNLPAGVVPSNAKPSAKSNAEPLAEGELPEGVTKAPTRIPVATDEVLLEVAQLPIGEGGADGGQPACYAYFETEGGVVEHRRPDQERQSSEYQLVRASYLLGQPTEGEE